MRILELLNPPAAAARTSPAILFAVPLATGAALMLLAFHQADATTAAETAYLALVATAVLLPVAGLAALPALELFLPAFSVAILVTTLPAGDTRGAAVSLLLAAALATVAVRHLARQPLVLSWAVLAPLALGCQLLYRSNQLLAASPDLESLVSLAVLPVAAAAGLALLANRYGPAPVLIAAASLMVLCRGWSVAATLGVLLFAGLELWREGELPRWSAPLAAGILLVAAALWYPALAWILAFGAIVWWSGEGASPRLPVTSRWTLLAAAVVMAAIAAQIAPATHPWRLAAQQLAWLPLLLPAGLLPARSRLPAVVGAMALAAVGLRFTIAQIALPIPLLLLALSMRQGRAISGLQAVWSGTLTALTLVAASYPWLRNPPLARWLPADPTAVWLGALGLVAVLGVAGFLAGVFSGVFAWGRPSDVDGRRLSRYSVTAVGLAMVAIVALARVQVRGVRLVDQEVVQLTGADSVWSTSLEPAQPTSSVIVDTFLAESADLPAGTVVATVRLTDAGGRAWEQPLRVGIETGEWAARRPNVARLPGFVAPPPWISWVAPGHFFAQRYRARWRLDALKTASRVEIARRPDLPPETVLAIFHLELER